MGFVTILILVLAALVILSILFSIFKFFIGLLPVAIIVALIIWLLAKFSSNKKIQIQRKLIDISRCSGPLIIKSERKHEMFQSKM